LDKKSYKIIFVNNHNAKILSALKENMKNLYLRFKNPIFSDKFIVRF